MTTDTDQDRAISPTAAAISKLWEGLNALEKTEFMDTSDRSSLFYRLRGTLRLVESAARQRGILA